MTREEFVESRSKELAETVYDLLDSGLHKKNPFSEAFCRRSIANSLYDQAVKIPSGMISVKAKDLLDSGYKRKDLCKEHPYPRTRTALDLINTFEDPSMNTSVTISKMTDIVKRGSKVHLVTSKENQALYPFQQDYTLSEEQIYSLAGVILIPDSIDKYRYKNQGFASIPDLSSHLGVSKYQIQKMIKNGEIEVVK